MAFIIRVTCLDLHKEQIEAWQALVAAKFPREAYRTFTNLDAVNYETARTRLKKALDSKNRIEEVRLAKELSDQFRAQYKEVARLAKEGK
jgi:dihydroneopterin aldolase